MKMDSHTVLEKLDLYLQKVLQKGNLEEEFHFPLDPELIDDEELKTTCKRFSLLFEMISEACQFSEQLAKGNLQVSASRNNFLTMPLKGLQANLAHLTWQVNQVAEGDLNQQVSFLGEFSDSFNYMIESLREKKALEQRLKIITDVLEEGILYVNNAGEILIANPGALTLLGYSFEEIEGTAVETLFQKPLSERKSLQKAVTTGLDYNENDGLIVGKSEKEIPVMISGRPVYKNKKLNGTVITFRDITEQKNHLQSLEIINKLLEKQAMTDALTGIYNRMKFDKILAKEIQRAKRNQFPLSLIICDIDHFKQVNDQYGHSAGDIILKRLSKLITNNIRSIDFFARWGGEEFVILSPGSDSEGSRKLAEKIRKKIEEYKFPEPEHLTLSFGIASFQTGDSAAKLINRADEAMYKAKKNGRNQVQVSSPE